MSPEPGDTVLAGDGRRWVLDTLLKSGGAGSVFRLRGEAAQVAKLYHPSVDHAVYERKVAAMLQLSPQLPDLADGAGRYVQIAWPSALLRDARGRFLGFTMPAVDIQATSELELVLQERQARAAGLPTGLGAKVTLAANLAAVIAELHKQQHRVVDLKPVNLRFYKHSLYMAMLDCDGFSIQGEGERFPAPQFTADYLAPEFQANGITVAGEEQQDRFALAVIVFQLLNFGIHPFTGRPRSERVPTDIPGRIAGRYFAYGLRPHPDLQPNLVSGHAAMPAAIRQLFDRAFESPGQTRPPALEWASVLRGYAQRANQWLVACAREPEHQHFAGQACAACARAALISKTTKEAGAARRYERPASPPPPAARKKKGKGQRAPAPVTPAAWNQSQPLIFTPPRPPPPTSIANVLNSLVHGFHTTFGVRGWMIVIFLGYKLISLATSAPLPPPVVADLPPPPSHEVPGELAPDPSLTNPAIDLTGGAIQPIATTDDYPTNPASTDGREWKETRELVEGISQAMAAGNREAADGGMVLLRRVVHGHAQAGAGDYQDHLARFQSLIRSPVRETPGGRTGLRTNREQFLAARPYDPEAACEWAWLVLADGQRGYAEAAFVRAIWADPSYSGGWAGLGAVATDDGVRLGALAMAESWRAHSEADAREIEEFTENELSAVGMDQAWWRVLNARGKKRSVEMRGGKVSEEVEELAGEELVGETESTAKPQQGHR